MLRYGIIDLAFKLKVNGVSGQVFLLLTNYLVRREDLFKIWSTWSFAFLIFINDSKSNLKFMIKFFADYTSIPTILKDLKIYVSDLNTIPYTSGQNIGKCLLIQILLKSQKFFFLLQENSPEHLQRKD